MPASIPSYSALYSISDLHLGGEPGMQMFARDERLGGFLHWLASPQAHKGELALVLAGDVIDSLPSLGEGSYVAIDGAADLVRATARSFPATFEGLSAFVNAAQRELVVLIGNHDIELALPEARAAFLECIGADGPNLRGRIRFETSGTGFRCSVGRKTVYVTHGNEADPWNRVDHEALRRAAHARSLGLPFDKASWVPNAGTMLVVEAMNDIKRRYPFVDLLKPERAAALRLLAVLDERRIEHVYSALPAFARGTWTQKTGPDVVLGASERAGDHRRIELLSQFETASLAIGFEEEEMVAAGAELFEKVLRLHRAGKRPGDLVRDEGATLGVFSTFRDWLDSLSHKEAFRRGLKRAVARDASFRLDDEDEVFKGVLGHAAGGIDVVITGHTHLARWIPRKNFNRPDYLNAGTWARLMFLPGELLDSGDEFERLMQALRSPDIATLDGYEARLSSGPRKILLDATCAARVDDGGAGLVRVRGDGTDVQPVDRDSDPRSWS